MDVDVKVGNCLYPVRYHRDGRILTVDIDGRIYRVDAAGIGANLLSLLVNDRCHEVMAEGGRGSFSVVVAGQTFQVDFLDPRCRRTGVALASAAQEGRQVVLAPMAGQIVKVRVGLGHLVKDGEGLVVLEAMKMENEIKSQGIGEVREVLIGDGDVVVPGQRLLVID